MSNPFGNMAVAVTPQEAGGRDERQSVAPPRVLLVDDDHRNLLALSEVLEDVAEIVTADSGAEALRHLLKGKFAVILLDVLMPGLDGYETAKLARMREQSRDTPIIFLTAINKEDAHLMRGYDSGAVDFVFKPVDPVILRSKVAVFVSLYEKTREIERTAQREQVLLQETLKAQAERLEVHQALREAEERQALLLRSLPLAVFHMQPGSETPSFIAGDVEGLTGFSSEAFNDDTSIWQSRIHPDDLAAWSAPFGASAPLEYRWQHQDGGYRVFVDQRVQVSERAGAWVGTLRDITEQRLLQDQLLQSQKLDAIGKLTGGIAHDFNNLLASVLSGIGLLERRSELDERGRKILEMMRHAAQQGTHLVNRMLTFSRRQHLHPERVDVAQAARALDGMLRPILGGLVTLRWELDDSLWPTFVDSGELELALMNLIINARDAMPTGGTVTVAGANRQISGSAQDDLAPGDYVLISVSDTGAGIPPELLKRVLEPFFTTKDPGKGTGLGLSSVLGFAQQSGGSLRIQSEQGSGTRAEVWLPRSGETAQQDVAAAIREAEPMLAEGQTVLLVDDAIGLRDLTRMHLSDAGYIVACAASGTEALEIIQGGTSFDVIVTDYAMPSMSGLDLIMSARALKPGWPAVIISGFADVQEIAKRPSDIPLLTKPFARSALLNAIKSVVGQF